MISRRKPCGGRGDWALLMCSALATHGADDLARQFADPPDTARPWGWANWLHGDVNREGMTREPTLNPAPS